MTPFCLASQSGLEEVTDVLLECGADRPDTSELPRSGSPPVTTSPGCPADSLTRLKDSPIPSHPSLTNTNVADLHTDLPQTPSSFLPPLSSNDILTGSRKRDPPPVFFSRRFLCSLVLAIVAVALPFLIRSVPRAPAVGLTT